MEYVLAGILVVLLVGGFVAFLAASSRKRTGGGTDRRAADRSDEGAPGVGADRAPLGDTEQHAGTQDEPGRTTRPADAEQAGGTGRPASGAKSVPSDARPEEPPPGRFQRDPVGGEAEARPYGESSGQPPKHP